MIKKRRKHEVPVGAAGGNIVDAAKLQYVLSRILPPGQKTTPEQIGRAVGMLGGGLSEALLNRRAVEKQMNRRTRR